MLNERLITQLSGEMAPALRVTPENAPLRVARTQSTRYAHGVGSCSFGVTKPCASRLDGHFFRGNSNVLNRVEGL